jgi:ketosteroid isomerase-like protein
MTEVQTRRVVEAVYAAHRAHDVEALIALLAADVEVTFLGRGRFGSAKDFREYLMRGPAVLRNVQLDVKELIIDGASAAGLWEETAETASGGSYQNHGVDVFVVRDGAVCDLVVCDDVVRYREAVSAEGATKVRDED